MKKDYLYLVIAVVVLYIIVQNKKDEKQEENRIITIGGRRYWDEPIKLEDSKPAPDPEKRKEVYEVHKPSKAGEGLIS